MFSSYSSKTGKLDTVCKSCGAKKVIDLKDLKLHVGTMKKGLFLVLPRCENCKSFCTAYTGGGLKDKTSHYHFAIAKAALKVGAPVNKIVPGESEEDIKAAVVQRLDEIEKEYETGSLEHQQFLGEAVLVFPETK